MPQETVNVAIEKPLHKKICRIAKEEQRKVRAVTTNLLNDAIAKREQQAAHTGGSTTQ
jgi:hypothetical protein